MTSCCDENVCNVKGVLCNNGWDGAEAESKKYPEWTEKNRVACVAENARCGTTTTDCEEKTEKDKKQCEKAAKAKVNAFACSDETKCADAKKKAEKLEYQTVSCCDSDFCNVVKEATDDAKTTNGLLLGMVSA